METATDALARISALGFNPLMSGAVIDRYESRLTPKMFSMFQSPDERGGH